jgi:hypothetical protein
MSMDYSNSKKSILSKNGQYRIDAAAESLTRGCHFADIENEKHVLFDKL